MKNNIQRGKEADFNDNKGSKSDPQLSNMARGNSNNFNDGGISDDYVEKKLSFWQWVNENFNLLRKIK